MIKESNERWNSDGDCSKCRRNNYCKTTCKAHKSTTNKQVTSLMCNILDKYTGGAHSEVLGLLNKYKR